ncbi:MAG TPA: VanZ family protein [Aggregatilineaceae bacterium]|nr:VanZ family protein [Aggregatilineaceae bacterium]
MSAAKRLSLIMWSWGPVLVLMLAMFIFSAQPKTPPPAGAEAEVYFSGPVPIFPGGWDFVIKKSTHIAEYGVLTWLMARALVMSGMDRRDALLFAILGAISYGFLDELHQSVIPGRSSSLRDVGFDTLGALLTIPIERLRRYGFR